MKDRTRTASVKVLFAILLSLNFIIFQKLYAQDADSNGVDAQETENSQVSESKSINTVSKEQKIDPKKKMKKIKIKNQRALFDGNKVIEVKLASTAWNKSSETIDNGVILLKDGNSNKVVQVLLEETAPDTNIFSGTYSVNWGNSSQVKPEVYVLDNSSLLSQDALKSVIAKINSGSLKRKPIIFRKNELGVQVLEVFETNELAKEALSLIRKQSIGSNFETTSITGRDLGLTQKLLSTEELKKLADSNSARVKENQKRILDRYRQEQIEKARIEKLKKELGQLSQQQKDQRERESNDYAEAALDFYRANNFTEAEEKFRKSFDLFPENKKYFFQYGMSLYKNQKYNEAVVAFSISKDMAEFKNESIYYMALCQHQLKEYEQAIANFNLIKDTKDEKLAPLANFYSGLVYYEQQFYEKSKAEFELVLDTSKDPRLDEKAEKYIETINQLMMLAKMKEKKFFFSGSLGALYDSNVLQQSDSSSDQGSASDKASIRYITGVGFYYRPIYDTKKEFGPRVRADYIYTQKDELSDYDPLSLQITAPYSQRGEWLNKTHILNLKPGYELLHLGQEDDSGRPEKTLKGLFLDTSNSFVMKESWITGAQFNIRKDDFYEDTDKNAMKFTLKWTNVLLVDDAKTKTVLADFGLALSKADDDDYTTQRIDLSGLYVTPILKDKATFIGGLSIYRLDYPDKSTAQTDMNYTLSANVVKPLTDWLSGTVVSNYSINKSDVDSSDYKRWSIGMLFSAEVGF